MKEPSSLTEALPRCGADSSLLLEEAEKASSGTAPVLTPNHSGTVSETKSKQNGSRSIFKVILHEALFLVICNAASLPEK